MLHDLYGVIHTSNIMQSFISKLMQIMHICW